MRRFEPRGNEGPNWVRYGTFGVSRCSVSTSMVARLRSLGVFAKNFSIIVFKRLISYELISADIRLDGGIAFVRAACGNIVAKLMAPARIHAGSRGQLITDALTRDGICVVAIEPNQLARIDAAAQPLLNRLAAHAATGKLADGIYGVACCTLRQENDELFAAVETMLNRTGILAGVSTTWDDPLF